MLCEVKTRFINLWTLYENMKLLAQRISHYHARLYCLDLRFHCVLTVNELKIQL